MANQPDHRGTTTKPADEAAVRGLYQQLRDGWNRSNGEAFAAVFTEDGDLVAPRRVPKHADPPHR
jgi:hypothetical protein